MTTFTTEEFLSSLKKAPRVVQRSFESEKTSDVIIGIRNQYKLHVDTTSSLSLEIGYLLVGLINPAEFLQRIQSLGIDATIANSIVQDINREIFVPLQQKMREAPTEDEDEDEDDWHEEPPVMATPPSEPMVPIMQVGMSPQNIPTYSQSPAPVASPINLIQPAIQAVQPVAPEVTPTFVPTPPQKPVFAPATPAQQSPSAQMSAPAPHEMLVHPRTMQGDMAIMGQGGSTPTNLPGVLRTAPMPASVGQSSPARAFQTSSIANTAHDVPEQVMAQRTMAQPAPSFTPARAPAQITPSVPLRDTFANTSPPRSAPSEAPSGDYRVDPYRELPQ